MEVINLPYRYTILIWRVVSSRFLTMDAIKIYIGSAGSIPARQVLCDNNKLHIIHMILKVLTAGYSGGFLYT